MLVLVLALLQSFHPYNRRAAVPPPAALSSGRQPRISIEPPGPHRIIPLSGALHAPVAVDPSGAVRFLTDDGVLGKISAEGRFEWSVYLSPADGAPALDDAGYCYVAGRDGRLYAVDAEGLLQWTRPLWGRPVQGVTVGRSRLVVALSSGQVRFFATELRRLVGSVTLPDAPSAAPAERPDGQLVVGTVGGLVVGFDEHGVRWQTRVARVALAPPAVGAGSEVLVGAQDGSFAMLDAAGAVRWTARLPGAVARSPVIGENGGIFVAAGGKLLAFAPDGHAKWQRPLDGRIVAGPLVADDGSIYVALARESHGEVVALGEHGDIARRIALAAAPAAGLSLARRELWLGLANWSIQRLAVPQLELLRSPWAKARGGLGNRGAP